jgi:uncharacterized protein (DUF305 family)
MACGHMQMSMSGEGIPEECRTATQAGGHVQMIQGMDMQGMMANMNDAQKGYVRAMMKMHGPILTEVMAKDSDLAFVCGRIAHHQGTIDMAQDRAPEDRWA